MGQSASVIPSTKIATGPVPTLKAKVQEVPLVLSVTDHKGKYVDRLAPSDLTILDNNQEQTAVTFFEEAQDRAQLDRALPVQLGRAAARALVAGRERDR